MESLTFKQSLLDALDQDCFTCAWWNLLNQSVNAFWTDKTLNCDSIDFIINFIVIKLFKCFQYDSSMQMPFFTKQINFGKTENHYLKQSLVLISTIAMNNGSWKNTTECYLL